jgi:hypothetical protein
MFSVVGLVAAIMFLEDPRVKRNQEKPKSEKAALSEKESAKAQEPAQKTDKQAGGWFPQLSTSGWFSILTVSFISFVQVGVDEIYSLWCKQSVADGGLGWDIDQVGTSLCFAGITTLFIQVLVYPKLDKSLGTKNCFRLAMALYGVVLVLNPCFNALAVHVASTNSHPMLLWLPLLLLLSFRALAATCAFTSAMILVSACAQSTGASAGMVNGLSNCLAATFRMGAPVLAGILWSWSLWGERSWPLNFHCVFLLLSATCALAVGATWFIKSDKKDEVEKC